VALTGLSPATELAPRMVLLSGDLTDESAIGTVRCDVLMRAVDQR
jgi:hypothetical protein